MFKFINATMLMLVATFAFADTVHMVCRDKFDATVSLTIDAKAQKISASGVPATNVLFTEASATFDVGNYTHTLDRVSGVLYVEQDRKTLSPFHCRRSTPLF
jgi:hypothetical protein